MTETNPDHNDTNRGDALTNPEIAYCELRPMMLNALAKIAREGIPINPHHALDLIHDFFIDVWPRLIKQYNHEKGSLKSYTFVAFVNFVRPIAIRDIESKKVLSDVRYLLFREQKMGAEFEYDYDLDLINRALKTLDKKDYQLLMSYFGDEQLSERQVALRTKSSRYTIRRSLTKALARLAVLVEKPPSVSSNDWKVSRALFLHRRSITQVAIEANLNVREVRQVYNRTLHALAKGLLLSSKARD